VRLRAVALLAAVACLAEAASGAEQTPAELTVRSVDLILSQRDDAPVVRGQMTTQPGGPYTPAGLAGDLYRLAILGYDLARFEARFTPKGVAVTVVASHAEDPEMPPLAAVDLRGGVPEIDRAVRPQLRQQPTTLRRIRRADYHAVLLDARSVERGYRARGYLDARVRRVLLEADDDGGAMRLTFAIESGTRYTVGRTHITIEGARDIPADEMGEALGVKHGRPWSDDFKYELADRAANVCRERGYLDARADAVPRKKKDGTVEVHVEIEAGERCVLRQVVIRDAGPHRDAVARLVRLRKGQVVRLSEVEALKRAIEDLGLFDEIETLFVPVQGEPAGRRDLILRLDPVDLGREIGEAERLYYEMGKAIIRLHNRGAAGLRSLRVTGWGRFGGRKVTVDVAAARPDAMRVDLSVSMGAGPPRRFALWRKGDRAAVSLAPLHRSLLIPAVFAPKLKFRVVPPRPEADLPTQIELGMGCAAGRQGVFWLGRRCPPAAVYHTKLAARFARTPPSLDADGRLVLPPTSDETGPTVLTLGPDRLPRRIVLHDKAGRKTGRFDVAINPDLPSEQVAFKPEALDAEDTATGRALLVPVLSALALPEPASALAEKAAAEHPKNPACLAVRGLTRLPAGPPGPGLADLRTAAKLSDRPAYDLLLVETLLRGERFAEADAACRALLDTGMLKTDRLNAADLLLDAGLHVRSALNTLMAGGPRDYRRRATADRALALIGLKRYHAAAELARELRADQPGDRRAAELLARCELGLSRFRAALDALAPVTPAERSPQALLYAALARSALGEVRRAAASIDRAMNASPVARNLLLLQEQAAEIHPRWRTDEARAALAEAYSRAALGPLTAEQKKTAAAVVNDVIVETSDVERVLRRQAGETEPGGEAYRRLRAAARRRVIEDALITRWATWRGIRVPADAHAKALNDDLARLGVHDLEQYEERLKEEGTTLSARRAEIIERLLKREAFSRILAERVLVRPAEVREYYEAHPKQFTVPETARFRMITLHYVRYRGKEEAVRTAHALRRRLRAKPETFAELAHEYSHDANAEKGGLWEEVRKGSLLGPLDEAVFALKPGETSDVIETDRACHIVRLEKLQVPRRVGLEEAAPHILRAMQQRRAPAEIARWLRDLNARSYVKVLGQ
jgi:parvulin-like peptidyl-prolyl isomerase